MLKHSTARFWEYIQWYVHEFEVDVKKIGVFRQRIHALRYLEAKTGLHHDIQYYRFTPSILASRSVYLSSSLVSRLWGGYSGADHTTIGTSGLDPLSNTSSLVCCVSNTLCSLLSILYHFHRVYTCLLCVLKFINSIHVIYYVHSIHCVEDVEKICVVTTGRPMSVDSRVLIVYHVALRIAVARIQRHRSRVHVVAGSGLTIW